MDYNHITHFLDKFKVLLSRSEGAHTTIAEVVGKHVSFPIDKSFIKTKGLIIEIQGSPLLRNEILIHKEKILRDLVEEIPHIQYSDIR